jgi:hypothetical protein
MTFALIIGITERMQKIISSHRKTEGKVGNLTALQPYDIVTFVAF